MTVLEYAKQLGQAIANDEVMKNFNESKKKYEENESLQKLLVEYNTHRMALGEQFKMDLSQQDEGLIKSIRARIDEIFSMIVANEDYKAYAEAQDSIAKLMNTVNSEINYYVFGERPCTHDCSTCSSNCGH